MGILVSYICELRRRFWDSCILDITCARFESIEPKICICATSGNSVFSDIFIGILG